MGIAACACMLAIASILDIKSREIPDKVWLAFGGAGLLITVAAVLDGSLPYGVSLPAFLVRHAIGIAIISAIGYAAYRTGLLGGADPKALVTIAILIPTLEPAARLHDIVALTVFTNALIVSLAGMLCNVARNALSVARGVPIFDGVAESGVRKALAFAVGFPASSSGKYLFAMEDRDELGRRRFVFNPARYNDFAQPSDKRMWVTQALPFIVYIGIGFALTLVAGDLLALLFGAIL